MAATILGFILAFGIEWKDIRDKSKKTASLEGTARSSSKDIKSNSPEKVAQQDV